MSTYLHDQTCDCGLPLRVLTTWTSTNPARRMNLYEMYNTLNPQKRRQLGQETSRQVRIEGLEVELVEKNLQLQKSLASLTFGRTMSRENQAPGVIKPEIRGNVNFKIKSQFMRELREDTFSGNKDEDAHDHIDRVLSIVGLFNIPGVSKDAVMLRVFPFTFTGSAKRWVDRLALGTINTWDLLKKAFIQRPGSGPIPGMRRAQDLTAIQTMADHSQKWHDGTTSRNIGSSSNKDGLAALVNKLDNLARDMKKLKESVHAIQVGCQFAKDLTSIRIVPLTRKLNKLKRSDIENLDEQHLLTERQSLEELLAKHQEESARRSTENGETQIAQLTKEIRYDKTLNSSSEQIKTVTADQKTSGLNKLIRVSFISGPESDTHEVLQHQQPPKELNLRSFTLPFMIDMSKKAPLGIVENVLVKIDKLLFSSDFVIIDNTPSETTILGRPFLAIIHAEIDVFARKISLGIDEDRISFDTIRKDHKYTNPSERIFMIRPQSPTQSNNQIDYEESAKYGKSQTDALVWDNRYAKWCDISPSSGASSQESNKPRTRDYTFREWTLIKVGHTDISELVKKALLKLWLIDCFQNNSAFENNPTHRSFDDYKWEFNLKIDKLADEYRLGIGKKGYILDNIWEYCNQVHNTNYEWHNYEFENEECEEVGIEDKDYHPPEVQVETLRLRNNRSKVDKVSSVIQKLRGNYRDRLDSYSCGNFAEFAAVVA
ncbi:putative reverse transcriptase domain-containing protein [Tanacetum coccineum]